MTRRIKEQTQKPAAAPTHGSFSLISKARLIEIYSIMLRCRMLRERVHALGSAARQGGGLTTRPGSEAVAASAIVDLLPRDLVVSSSPDLFAPFVRGVPLESILRPVFRRTADAQGGIAEPDFKRGVVAGAFSSAAQLGVAVGAALAQKMAKRGDVTVVFCSERGAALRESLDFAAAHALPILFVRQGKSPLEVPAGGGKWEMPALNLPVMPVDRDDAVAVYRVAHEAIQHLRRGDVPTLIDCVALRIPGRRITALDSIRKMGAYLEGKGLNPEPIKARVAAEFGRELDAAIDESRRDVRSRRKTARIQ